MFGFDLDHRTDDEGLPPPGVVIAAMVVVMLFAGVMLAIGMLIKWIF